jgi:SAM-dependent methyltransferase
MKNINNWKPSKFIYKNGKLTFSKDKEAVGVGSRLITQINARYYDQYIKKYAEGRLLDLGCGQIPLYIAYREHVQENICVDWENSLHRNEHLDFEGDLSKKLPFKDSEFHTIILSDVLEHLPEPGLLWNEMNRLLAPGGRIMMNVPFYYWIHEQPHDYYRYTEYALRRYAEISNFIVLDLEPIGGAPEILADIIAKLSIRIPFIGEYIAMFVQWFTLLFGRFQLGKNLSNATKHKFPLGYFMVVEKPYEL